jgi:hypothetical protein
MRAFGRVVMPYDYAVHVAASVVVLMMDNGDNLVFTVWVMRGGYQVTKVSPGRLRVAIVERQEKINNLVGRGFIVWVSN